MIHTFTERHLLPVMTPAAILRRIGGDSFDKLSASFFRFAGQFVEEFRPRGILNALRETMVMGHTVDMQVFNCSHSELIDNVAAFLMGEIVTTELDTLMHPRHNLAMLAPLKRTFGKLAMLALDFCQGLFLFTNKAGIGYRFSARQGGKGFQTDVHADLGRHISQAFRLALARKGDVPFASGGTLHRTRLDFALEGTVIDHLDTPHLGESHAVIMRDAKATLREGEAIVAISPTTTRVARIFTGFTASKECLEGQVNTDGDILQYLRMSTFKRGAFLCQDRIGRLLLVARETFSRLRVGMLAHLPQVIIQPTTLIKGLVELVKLLPRWIYSILKHFTPIHMICLICSIVKCSLPAGSGLFIPMSEARGLQARKGKKVQSIITRLKGLRRQGNMHEGVKVNKVITVKMIAHEPDFKKTLSWLDPTNKDDCIIAATLEVQREEPSSIVVLVTNDINHQNKAEMANLPFIEPPDTSTSSS